VVGNVDDLQTFEIVVTYGSQVEVVDADPATAGVQVQLGQYLLDNIENVVVARNEVDTTNRRISFAATILPPPVISGSETALFEIDWQAASQGTAALQFQTVSLFDSSAGQIQATTENGTVNVSATASAVSGQVALQGRDNYGGVVVTSDSGTQTQTNPDGSFSIEGSSVVQVQLPGYLSAQADIQSRLQSQSGGAADFQTVSLGGITLLAGDVNTDDTINILDLAYIAMNYQSTDQLADLNGDGQVNIVDLALAAGNYAQDGPLTQWQ